MKKKKLKIGLFIDVFFPMIDGVVMVVDNYARRLVKYADVYVFAPECDNGKMPELPYKVVRCKSIKLPFLDYSLPIIDNKFKKILKDIDLDIVHIHSPFSLGKYGVKYAEKRQIPVVATMHSQYKKEFKRAIKSDMMAGALVHNIIKNVYDKCDECWAVNNEVARIFYKEYKYKKMPYVQNNATDLMLIDNKDEADGEINKLYNIQNDEHVFLFVGRINKLKNILFIVDSLNIVRKKGLKYKMLFVGCGQDENELRKRIEGYNLQNHIILCGRITDRDLMSKIYSRAELFLFPSLYDASSLVQIEAASQKTPAIFIEGAATAKNIINDRNGFITKNSVEDYAEKIIQVMNDDKLYNEVSNNAYKEIYKNWDDNVKEVYECYEKLSQ